MSPPLGRSTDAKVYRSDRIPKVETNALSVLAARVSLLHTVGATLRSGIWLNGATGRYPAAVLGADAAGASASAGPARRREILVGRERFTVIGVLDPVALAPELDTRRPDRLEDRRGPVPASTGGRQPSTPGRATARWRR